MIILARRRCSSNLVVTLATHHLPLARPLIYRRGTILDAGPGTKSNLKTLSFPPTPTFICSQMASLASPTVYPLTLIPLVLGRSTAPTAWTNTQRPPLTTFYNSISKTSKVMQITFCLPRMRHLSKKTSKAPLSFNTYRSLCLRTPPMARTTLSWTLPLRIGR